MSRVVVVLPLEPLAAGQSFAVDHWPLHVTVVPPFSTRAQLGEVSGIVAAVASRFTSLSVVAAEDAMFGRRENIPVTLIADDARLTQLHRALLDALRAVAESPHERSFTRNEFRAHVTTKKHNRAHAGDVLHLGQIAVVDMAPRAHPGGRAVLATVDLTEAADAAESGVGSDGGSDDGGGVERV